MEDSTFSATMSGSLTVLPFVLRPFFLFFFFLLILNASRMAIPLLFLFVLKFRLSHDLNGENDRFSSLWVFFFFPTTFSILTDESDMSIVSAVFLHMYS